MKKITVLGLCIAFLIAMISIPDFQANNIVKAADEEIAPVAWYEFNDQDNPGKDSMGKYDLKKLNTSNADAIKILQDGEDNYLQLTSLRDEEGQGGNAGACLYAPELGQTGKDFSDLIKYSYSVEITFRRDNTTYIGNHYVLALGRYNNAFQITPWKNSIEIQVLDFSSVPGETEQERQQYMEQNSVLISKDTTDWTTVLVSADYASKTITVYVDGVSVLEQKVENVAFSYEQDPYAFTLGAQCMISGSAATQFATADIKDCKVFDVALNANNAQQLFQGNSATFEGAKYIQSVDPIDTTGLNLNVTDVNTLNNIITNVLPQKVNVTLNDGSSIKADVAWMSSGNKLNGYIQSQFANINQLYLETNYGYTVDFAYDNNLVAITGIKLDGQAFTPGSEIDSGIHIVTFRVTVKEHSTLDSVVWYEMEQEEIGGEYEVSFSGGACIIVESHKTAYAITYMEGKTVLGSSNYTYNGAEVLSDFNKEGYEFEGWYTDEALTQKFAALDYENPENITVYAKYVKIANNNGSNLGLILGIVFGSLAVIAAGTVAVIFIMKKKKTASK